MVIATLNARIMPLTRGELFEDPLEDLPDERKIPFGLAEGLEVTFETAELADSFVGRLNEAGNPVHHYGDYGAGGRSLNLYGPSAAEMEAVCRQSLLDEVVTITQIV